MSCKMIHLLVESYIFIKGKRHLTFQFRKYMAKVPTNYVLDTLGDVLQY